MSAQVWRGGNRVSLLENGEEYYPRVFAAMAAAQKQIHVETFILFEDPVGHELQATLIAAAQRGVSVTLLIDGYGSADLSSGFISAMTDAGVRLRVFDPKPKLLGIRTNFFRRLHRKLVVCDGKLAFVGGLNFSVDHLRKSGPDAKQDYAVEVEGAVVNDIQRFVENQLAPVARRVRWHWWRRTAQALESVSQSGGAYAAFVTRDNGRHRNDIEREYRDAIRAAREEILIGNAYFFPGRRLLRDLLDAARRGVRVRLILQGHPDQPIMTWAGQALYDELLNAGAAIFEYCERPLHGKVALVDSEWATVGSSNLDPLSLSLNLEANLMIRDRAFNRHLRERLELLMRHHCRALPAGHKPRWSVVQRVLSFLSFHGLRHFPSWGGWLPGHKQADQKLRAPLVDEDAPRSVV